MSSSPTLEKAQAAAADEVGAYPRDYDTSALPERRYAALARMAIIIATVEAFAIGALGLAFAALMPLQKVIPMVVTSNDRGDEVIHINPITLDTPTIDYVTEIGLRQYVQRRYSISASAAEQAINWGAGSVVQLMSTPEAFDSFMNNARAEHDRIRSAGMIRQVRIDSVRKIGDNVWQVSFVTTDTPEQSVFGAATAAPQGQAPVASSSQAWVSTFEVIFEPRNVKYSDRLNNPFGMTVTSVNDARRD